MIGYACLAMLIVLLDQVSKFIIENDPALHAVEIIKGFFRITYAKNTGMAWSMLSGQTGLLAIISAAAILLMLWYALKEKHDRLTQISLWMMIGGAAGNLIDRLFIGYVRDFLDFIIFGYDFPVFNIADSFLCIGVFILLIASLREENGKNKADS
ncbi:MAG: signal peptidase II [Solobacterium sp.]|nr:signal peptidase II [Solobacterium sp.]